MKILHSEAKNRSIYSQVTHRSELWKTKKQMLLCSIEYLGPRRREMRTIKSNTSLPKTHIRKQCTDGLQYQKYAFRLGRKNSAHTAIQTLIWSICTCYHLKHTLSSQGDRFQWGSFSWNIEKEKFFFSFLKAGLWNACLRREVKGIRKKSPGTPGSQSCSHYSEATWPHTCQHQAHSQGSFFSSLVLRKWLR